MSEEEAQADIERHPASNNHQYKTLFHSWIEYGRKSCEEEAQADIEQAIAEGRAEKAHKRSKLSP